jgi:tetratricopeptide (TPR) repeat protein
MFNDIIYKLYGNNPYLGFETLQTTDIRQINGRVFEFLIASLRPKTIAEVGSWKGSSAIKMAKILEQYKLKDSVIICIDTWLGSPEHWLWKDNKEWGFDNLKIVNGFPTIYETFLSNVINSNVQDKIIPFPQTSENAVVIFQKLNLKFDLIYIDAAHEYEPVWRDLQGYYPLLNRGGIIFGDDYLKWEGVRQAVNDFAEKFNLKVYSKGEKYILVNPENNLDRCERIGLKQGAVKSKKEIIELGLIARQQGKEQEALKYFEQAISFYPKVVSGYVEAGNSLRALQRLEEAKQRFEQALKRKSNNLEALMGFGEIAALEWDLETALEKFQKVIEHHPNHLNAYVQAAIQLRNLKRFTEAEKIADLGLSKCGNDENCLDLLKEKGLTLAGQVKLDQASEILKRFVELGGSFTVFFDGASMLSNQKMFEQAILFLDLNINFLKRYDNNWIKIQKNISRIKKCEYFYQRQIRRLKKNKPYKVLELHPQNPLLYLFLDNFDITNINQEKPGVVIANFSEDKIKQELDDLDGLLTKDMQELYGKTYSNNQSKRRVSYESSYTILTIPQTCLMLDGAGLPFSLKGYFMPQLLTSWLSFKYYHHCLIREVNKRLDCGFFMPSAGQSNYYHLLCEVMPALSFYQDLGLNCPIVFSSKSKPVIQRILQALDISPDLVMWGQDTEGIVFSLGIVCTPLSLSSKTVIFYRKIVPNILEKENIKVKKSERIYISRRHSSKRILRNEDKIEEILLKLGFDIYYMENYSFAEQIAIMEQAAIVVSPHGAGLTNILFCPVGTTVVELRIDKYPVECFEKLALICGHKYYPVLGVLEDQVSPEQSDNFYWQIDRDKVEKVVIKLIENLDKE